MAFRDAVSQAIQQMHAAGALKTLAEQDYGRDLAGAAAEFDRAALEQ